MGQQRHRLGFGLVRIMGEKILIVEDDREIRTLLSDFLTENGYEVVTASEGSSAGNIMRELKFSLILMDLMLPFRSGDELIKEFRQYSDTPVIVLSAKSMMETRLEVLRVGADDYIIKPFDLDEVLVRIEVVLRRVGTSGRGMDGRSSVGLEDTPTGVKGNANADALHGATGNLTADNIMSPDGRLILYVGENRVAYDGRNLTLTAKEMALLKLFLQYPSKTFTKANLYEAVWNDTYYYEDNTINVHMSNLRSKLKKQTGNDYIETVWGIGYRLKEKDK